MNIVIIILFVLCFHRVVLLMLAILPIVIITKIKKHYGGELPRGNRFVSFLDDIILHWISQIHCHHIRIFYYRTIFGAKISKNVVIYKGCEIRNPLKLTIGKGSIIGDDAILDARAGILIGENVNFSSQVHVWTLQHDYRDPNFACNEEHYGAVEIHDRVWLGPRTTILPNVIIGEGAVVGAGAVVTKMIAPYKLVGGVPAKVISERPKNLQYIFNGSHRHFI